MKMRFAILCLESDFHHWIQSIHFLQCEITPGVKNQPIDSGGHILAFLEQLSTTAILIGSRRVQNSPICGRKLFLQPHGNVSGRFAMNDVENVGRDASHS